jgi:hypothetical protein
VPEAVREKDSFCDRLRLTGRNEAEQQGALRQYVAVREAAAGALDVQQQQQLPVKEGDRKRLLQEQPTQTLPLAKTAPAPAPAANLTVIPVRTSVHQLC